MLRNIIIMASVLVVAVAAFIIIPKLQPKQTEEEMATPAPTPDMTELTISEKKVEDIDKVILENEGVTTVVIFDEATQKYMVEGAEDKELNQSDARNIFYTCSYVQAEQIITEDMSDLEQFGLKDPVSKVTVLYKDDTSLTFLYGNFVPGSGQHYMMLEGGDKVFVMWNNYGNNAKLKLQDLMALESQQITKEELKAISIYKNGELSMEFKNESDNAVLIDMSPWKLVKPYYRSVDASSENSIFYTMIDRILAIDPDSVVAAEGDPKDYGLDEPFVSVELTTIFDESVVINIGDEVDGQYAMKYGDSDIIYSIPKNEADFAKYEPIDMVEKLLMLVNVKYVEKVEMSGVIGDNTLVIKNIPRKDDEGNVKLDANGNAITDTNYVVDGVMLTEDEREQGSWFYQTILSAKVTREADEDFVPGKVAGAIKVTLNVEPNEYNVEFYEYDDYFYAVKFVDNERYLIVNRKDIDKIKDKYELLRSREMTSPY